LLRFQIAVDPLPFVQLRSVRVTDAQDAAQVTDDPCPEFLGFLFPIFLAQGDCEIGLADQGVRVVRAQRSPQQGNRLALKRFGLFEIL
jgi:hypothetical protein